MAASDRSRVGVCDVTCITSIVLGRWTCIDMSIIKHIRDALLHAVEKISPPSCTPMDLWIALQDSWCELPPGNLQTLVESRPRRFPALLRARGGPTQY
ncbi:hypothetical protein AVEN_252009-1 [Araneus ventricosus]|uniref:Uncharacterized protein n=1 Tax=Araneus ventricosus TaxID=182803 RepID=A0A4Y2QJB4_ARAVE|nr:hypothetical protein AVEN_252009-1 [Araneus ventricosus]